MLTKKSLNRLEQLQKRLYEKAYKHASNTPLIDAPEIIRYSENFYNSLPATASHIEQDLLLQKISESDILLYGDFHTFKQTQRGLIRLLRNYVKFDNKRSIILALEMFRRDDQQLVNQYLEGLIPEEDFLEQCKYSSTWGFPWQNYKVILDYARHNNFKVLGISTETTQSNSLNTRDQFAAMVLNKVYSQKPNSLIVCLIGEYHLADQHLPKHLDKKCRHLRILANIDHYYFANFGRERISGTEYIQLKKDLFCIINAPPWIKWQSYSIWEELRSAELENIEDGLEYTEETFDLDYQIVNLLNHLNDFLKLGLKKTDIYQFQTYLDPSEKDFRVIFSSSLVKKYRQEEIKADLELNGFSFLPETNTAIIKSISLNNLAEICGQLLYHYLHPIKNSHHSLENAFYHRIMIFSCGVLTSKILNPRRKCNDLSYYCKLKKELHNKRLYGNEQCLRATTKQLIKFINMWHEKEEASFPTRSLVKFDSQNRGMLSSHLGHLLGHYTYQHVIGTMNFDFEFTQFFQFSQQTINPFEQFLLVTDTLKGSGFTNF